MSAKATIVSGNDVSGWVVQATYPPSRGGATKQRYYVRYSDKLIAIQAVQEFIVTPPSTTFFAVRALSKHVVLDMLYLKPGEVRPI